MTDSIAAQSIGLETNYSLYLIDSSSVSYCRFCQKATTYNPDFGSKHRLFNIDTNEDLKDFLDKAITAFPSCQTHPHYRFLREVSSTVISGRLNFRQDFGSLEEAFQHFSCDISLSHCEPRICNLTHIRYNNRPWMNITLNLENCSVCTFSKDNLYEDLQDFSPTYIPSWLPLEDAKVPPCASVFRLQKDKPWTSDFVRTCPTCKRRRLLRTAYTLGLRKLWSELYTLPFCTCGFSCFSGF